MALYPTYLQRIGYHWICIAPASILSEDSLVEEDTGKRLPSLREEASRDGLCFLEVFHHMAGTDLYVAYVDANHDQVKERFFRVILTEKQLAFALPWDCRLQGKSSARILSILYAHGQEVLSLLEQKHTLVESRQLQPASVVPLTLCEEVAVTVENNVLQESIGHIDVERYQGLLQAHRISVGHMQQALLRVVMCVLSLKMLLVKYKDRTTYDALKQCRRKVAGIRGWQRRSHQRVVNVFPEIAAKDGRVVWRFTVGCPDRVTLAV